MMVDGKWTSSGHSSSAWRERTGYGTNTSSANTQNHGQTDGGATTGGRGICPPNWHVPTDHEWGIILDGMERDGGTAHQNASGAGWYGTTAGMRGKSTCTCTSGDCNNDADVSWSNSSQGTDVYGFRALPTGYRNHNGSYFDNRGIYAIFWSSSAYSSSYAWIRAFYYGNPTVHRSNGYNRSYGFSVRCIRDL